MRFYRRVLNTPKDGKTRDRDVSDGRLELLKEWAGLAHDPSPDGLVFPTERLATPLSLDNLWRRYPYPKLANIGLNILLSRNRQRDTQKQKRRFRLRQPWKTGPILSERILRRAYVSPHI